MAMKRYLTFCLFIVLSALVLCFGVMADEIKISANNASDIASAISGASSGDTIDITLESDIEVTDKISISKGITVNVYFNGKQINYTGSTSSSGDYACFYVISESGVLNLYGSNKLESYKNYTHFDDTVKADMIGTSNLVSIVHGTLNVYDMYMVSSSNAWAINSPYVDYNNCEINIKNSVLRCNENSSRSAITVAGKNRGSFVTKRLLTIDSSVVYGGFQGQDYNFNLTIGSKFTNVKFYDFRIKNDCWYDPWQGNMRELIMNSYDAALSVRECIFANRDESIGDIKIYTETGKQNLKLIDCTFNSIIREKHSADQGGDACVYVVTKEATCQESGTVTIYKNGNNPYDEAVAVGSHAFKASGYDYPNGYTKNGDEILKCTLCNTESRNENVVPAIFSILGYATNLDEDAVTYSVKVDVATINELKAKNTDLYLDYGMIAGNGTLEISVVDGEIKTSSGFVASCSNNDYAVIDLRITGFTDETLKEKKFAMEFYTFDGESVVLGDGKLDYYSYNDILYMLDETTRMVEELLESKHRLEYNEDGSFRVLILADLHMNASGDATNVQEVKDRVEFLVDKEKPNLVIFTGDNTIGSSNEEKLRANIDAIAGYLEENQIPWCHVYGNHDYEGALSNEAQQEIFESYEYCISKDVDGISGVGNYVHAVYKADGTIGSVIYLLDSGSYASGGGYDFIKDDQIEWYRETSMLLQEYNGGNVIPALMAFHIPLKENNDAYNNRNNTDIVYEWNGQKNEAICSSNTDTTLLETIFERGDIKAIVTGHDHINDYMFNYKGVKLTNSPNISDLTYYNAEVQGGRVFDLNADTISTDIKTYVSYIIERLNPDDFDDFENNAVAIDFEKQLDTVFRGYDNGNMNGNGSIEIADGKLVVSRSSTGNSEFIVYLENMNTIGNNKYLVVWMDLTGVEFRKACFGFMCDNGVYRTDDTDTKTPFYYLADGSDSWVELSHGNDGCFGSGDSGSQSMKDKKGYFAIPIEYMSNRGTKLNKNSLVTGLYMYLDISSNTYANIPFYIDNVIFTENYLTVELPNQE